MQPRSLDQLRTMGVPVHPHIADTAYDYCGGAPFHIQKITTELLTENARAYVLNSMGTGKTRCVLWAFDYLHRVDAVHRMLVVAPLSTLRFTWGREIFMTTPQYKYNVLHGTREQRLKLLSEPKDIYIVNHDGLRIIADELGKRPDIDVVVLDELAVFRNRTKRTSITADVCRVKPIVWGLTGAPMPNSPTDVYQQAKIVTPWTVPKYFGTFRDQTMLRINQFKWVPKQGSLDAALKAMTPSVRFNLDDVTELPPFISRRIDIDMGPKQRQVYEAVKKDCFALLQNGTIRAANAGAVMSKLLQISLGWVYKDDGSVVQLDNDARNDALLDLIEAAEHKVLVFVPFRHALAGLGELLTKAGISNETVSGETPLYKRDIVFRNFQNAVDPRVIVAHPKCMSHGITLTAADTVIWYGPITSTETYDQANARPRRIGQQHKQLFLHLQATASERHIYSLLTRHIVVQDELLKMLENESRTDLEGEFHG